MVDMVTEARKVAGRAGDLDGTSSMRRTELFFDGRVYTIELATSAEQIETVIDILEDAAQWVADAGVDHWVPGTFRSGVDRAVVIRRAAAESLYIVSHECVVVATIAIELSDPLMWPELSDDDSAFIHGFAVGREHKGLGGMVLEWAEVRAGELGKGTLRLDCRLANPVLPNYYRAQGFTLVDIVASWDGIRRCRFARRIAWDADVSRSA